MRCIYCGTKNIKKARYCSQCGAELCPADGRGGFLAAGSRRYWLTAICCIAGLALLFTAVFIALHHINGIEAQSGHEAIASFTPGPTSVFSSKPTLPPPITPEPTPKPTRIPLPTFTPTPAPSPAPTSYSPITPGTSSVPVYNGPADMEPVDALCEFMLCGEAAYARKAFPPEFITHTANSYGFVVQLLGSEDAVIEYAGNMLVADYKAKYGNITSIERTLASYKVLTRQELAELCEHLPEHGMTEMPTAAHHLTVYLVIFSDMGVFYERVEPHVLYINGTWYIDPEDIDM